MRHNHYLIKTLSLAILLFFFYGANLSAQEPSVNEVDGYIIEKGDTLWDISDRFLSDPFRWPEVWRLNRFIANPDLIFPGEVLNFRYEEEPVPLPVKELIEEPAKEEIAIEGLEIEEVEPGRLILPLSSLGLKRGFISKEEIKTVGVILASREDNILIREGDEVYVSMAAGIDIRGNKRFSIFDDLGEIIHPSSGDIVGHRIEIIGEIEIIDKKDGVYRAKIVDSYREIMKGAKLMSYMEPLKEVVVKKGESAADGIILISLEDKVAIAEKDVVFIDKGDNDGLEVGNILTIYRKSKDIPNPLSKKMITGSLRDIGSLVIIDIRDITSTAMVIKSKKAIYKGDIVRLCKDCI